MHKKCFAVKEYAGAMVQKMSRRQKHTLRFRKGFPALALLLAFLLPGLGLPQPVAAQGMETGWMNRASQPGLDWRIMNPHSGQVIVEGKAARISGPWPYVFNGYGGQWIWKAATVTTVEAQAGVQVSFYDRFCIPSNGSFDSISLLISADNAYEVYYVDANKNRTSGLLAQDGEWRTIESHSLPTDLIETNCQGFEISVTNYPVSYSDGKSNPAGLSYDLQAYYSYPTCDATVPGCY
jgi:hypothetical protein